MGLCSPIRIIYATDSRHNQLGKLSMKPPILFGACFSVLLFTACASTISAPQSDQEKPSSAPLTKVSPSPAEERGALRVIVTFKSAVDYRSDNFLRMLKSNTQTRQVTYVSSVYGNTHVYLIHAAEGQNALQVLQLLQNMPIIRSADIDRIARAS
jgi:hypothetical protein